MEQTPIRIAFELSRSTKNSMDLRNGNEMISSNDSINRYVKMGLVKHLRKLANIEARQYVGDLPEGRHLYSKQNPCHIFVHVHPPHARNMDAPNWYPTIKPLVDGLTDAGLFEDDNNNVITSMTFIPERKSGTKKYLIILEIRDGVIF